jgi:hypothetical protein
MYVTTDGHSASLSWNKAPIWGLQLDCGFIVVGRSLWREDGTVNYKCWWSTPPQSSGLATVSYCLRFETSLFVAPYDSQGYGGGIWPHLHTGVGDYCGQRQSHTATDGQSISKSWCRTPSGAHDQIFITVRSYGLVFVRRPLWREDGSVFYIHWWSSPA